MIQRARALRRRAVVAALGFAVVSAACAPRPGIEADIQDFDSEILFGAKAKLPELPPAPPAVLSPTFPGFIQPPPPVRDVFVSLPPKLPPAPLPRCKPPDLNEVPPAPPAAITGPPKPGVYSYRVKGSVSIGDQTLPLPAVQQRSLRVSSTDETSTVFSVEVPIGPAKVTTTYVTLRRSSDPTLDGLYIQRVVMEQPGKGAQVFEPAGPGLRVFAHPASVGLSWTSAATDPLHATSMRLSGTITQVVRYNVCGELIDGWESKVAIDVFGVGADGRPTESHIDAVYVVAPQLGGIFLSDVVKQTGTDRGERVNLDSEAVVENLAPKALVA